LVGSLMTAAYSRGELSKGFLAPIDSVNEAPVESSHENFSDLDFMPGDLFILNGQNHIQHVNQSARNNYDLYEHGGAAFTTMLGLDEQRAQTVTDLIEEARSCGAEQSAHILLPTNAGDDADYLRVGVKPLDDGQVALSLHKLDDNRQEIRHLQAENQKARLDIEEKSL